MQNAVKHGEKKITKGYKAAHRNIQYPTARSITKTKGEKKG